MRGQLVYAMERLSTPVELHANACRSQEIERRKMRGQLVYAVERLSMPGEIA